MNILGILTMVGGLAFFLYGMDLMGGSLTMMSGKKLQRILESLTDNAWKAIILGMGVTAVIQSSSGTTVMVVSLVNSGIMKLRSAIGVIMGANIGTTITAWILSLTGIESSNLFVQLLKPSSFSPVLAMAGVIMLMFSKKEKNHVVGKIMVGFAILMFGMDLMSGAMKPLAQMPSFRELFIKFSNPFLGILVGAVLTAIIQSSSASVGILQALCATGMVQMSAAIPIIMGQNIGTCITAVLSVIGAKRNAKRAAVVHLAFNIIGTVLFMVVYYVGEAFVDFGFASQVATPVSIAIAHSVFNITNTLILANFIGGLEKLAYLLIPESESEKKEKEDEFRLLDDRLLETPSVALQQAWTVSVAMMDRSKQAMDLALQLMYEFDHDHYEEVRSLESRVDRYQDRLGDYLLKISNTHMSDKDNLRLSVIMNSITDIERISDHALSIAIEARKLNDNPGSFSDLAMQELGVYTNALKHIINLTYEAYKDENTTLARDVEPLEEVIDRLSESIRIRHIDRLRGGLCTVEMGMLLTDVTSAMERVSDHCSNIAVALIEIHAGVYNAHKYLRKVKEKDTHFQKKLAEYLEAYQLPENIVEAAACASADARPAVENA